MKTNPVRNEKSLLRRIKQHVIAQTHSFFLICHPGFEQETIQELNNLKIAHSDMHEKGGIPLKGTIETCYVINTAMRTISRCLLRLFNTSVYNFSELYRKVNTFPWELYIKKSTELEFSISCKKSKLYHTDKIEEVVHEAIKNKLKEKGSDFSLFNQEHSLVDVPQNIFIRIIDNQLQCSLDTSGELLFKRGHRTFSPRAGLRETLAASILLASRLSSGFSAFSLVLSSKIMFSSSMLSEYSSSLVFEF